MQMTLSGIVARLDRLPVSRFHFVLLVIGAAACGFFADRVGRKTTILVTLVLYSLFSAARVLPTTS